MVKSELKKVAYGVRGAGRNDEVRGLVVLQHPPHGLNILRRISPVAGSVDIAHVEGVIMARFDAGDAAGDLACHESLSAPRALVVEEDPVDSEHAVGLAVVARHPVAVDLRRAIRA